MGSTTKMMLTPSMGSAFRKFDWTQMENNFMVPPQSRIVLTTYGPIVGQRLICKGQKKVDAYQGIPYAEPPIGKLRFKKPIPPKPWKEVKECKKFGARPIQKDFFPKKELGPTSEDCLTLNVFAPVWESEEESGFPVIVFIHGGAFVSDSCVKYGDVNICENLVSKNVVMVTVEYRLGYLGMWTTGDDVCRGNQNLWDMTLALRWVQENISRFGGNPGNVTLMGQSAGAAAVDLLSLSPHSRDLFQKVILMAGNAECEWSISKNNVETCRRAAEELGISSSEDSEKILEELRKLPADTFAMSMFDENGDIPEVLPLGPWVDGDFLPKHPSELRKEAPAKPKIIGLCRSEGLLLYMKPSDSLSVVDDMASKIFPQDQFVNYESLREEYTNMLMSLGIRNKKDHLMRICESYGDWCMAIGTQKCTLESVENGDAPVYLYRFDHYNEEMFGPWGDELAFKDSTHCGDISYLFGIGSVASFDFNDNDRKVSEKMCSFVANFATNGDPNGEMQERTEKWNPVTREKPQNNLQIGLQCEMNDKFYNGRPLWCALKKRENS